MTVSLSSVLPVLMSKCQCTPNTNSQLLISFETLKTLVISVKAGDVLRVSDRISTRESVGLADELLCRNTVVLE